MFFFDYDLDGYPDILAANGHIEEEINPRPAESAVPATAAPLPQCRPPEIRERQRRRRPQFARPIVARGAAYPDYDRDGDLDVLITTNNGPAYLFRNDGGNRNNFICIRTKGVKSNRDGIGAVIRIQSAQGKQWSAVRSGSSYCSQSDLAVTFALGTDTTVSSIDIEWPSGTKDHLTNVPANQFLTIEERKGIATRAAAAGSRRRSTR